MNLQNALRPGLAVLGFAVLWCFAPSCKAQEVDPDHFTLTGVETYPERTTPVPAVKKSNATQPALAARQAKLAQPVVQERKTQPTPSAQQVKLVQPIVQERKLAANSPEKSQTPAPPK